MTQMFLFVCLFFVVFFFLAKPGRMVDLCLSYDVASDSVRKPCVKNDNPQVD